MATGGKDFTVKLWQLPSGQQMASLEGHGGEVNRLAFAPDGQILASSDTEGHVLLWDWSKGRRLVTLRPEQPPLIRLVPLAFSSDGKTLAVANTNRQITLWDVQTRHSIGSMGERKQAVMAMALSPDDRTIVSAGWDGVIEIWDVAARKRRELLREHERMVCGLAFLPDGRRFVSAGSDGTLRVWSLESDPATGH